MFLKCNLCGFLPVNYIKVLQKHADFSFYYDEYLREFWLLNFNP